MNEKQAQQLKMCQEVLNKYNVELLINPTAVNWPLKAILSCDIEHNERGELVLIGFFDGKRYAGYTNTKNNFFRLYYCWRFIMHNGVSDIEALRSWGIPISDSQLVIDTMLLGHIIDSSKKSYGLKDMALRELQIEYPSYEDIVGKHKGKTKKAPKCPQTEVGCCGRVTLDKQPLELAVAYNSCDCVVTWLLAQKQIKELPDYALRTIQVL